MTSSPPHTAAAMAGQQGSQLTTPPAEEMPERVLASALVGAAAQAYRVLESDEKARARWLRALLFCICR